MLIPELTEAGPESRQVRRVALEAVLNALVLEHTYDPETLSQAQATAVLGRVFDLLMALPASARAKGVSGTSRRSPRARGSSR